MNPDVERLALRVRSWIVAHRQASGPALTDRLVRWGRAGSRWRWVVAWPALLVVTCASVLWWVVSQVAGVGAILAGWSPPLTLAALDSLPSCPEPAASVPPASLPVEGDDPAEWNFNHDPWVRLQLEQLAVQREHLAELRLQREARAAELTAAHADSQPHQTAGANQVPSYWWPPAAPRRRRRPLRVAHALVIVALVTGLAWGIGAFSLGVASSAGWIQQPPTFTQLDTPQGTTP